MDVTNIWRGYAIKFKLKTRSPKLARSIDDYQNRRYLHKSDLPEPKILILGEVTDETMQDGAVKPAAA